MVRNAARRRDHDREPWLEIVSYGRRGPSRPLRFSPVQLKQIARTAHRAPEVIVKVTGGGRTPAAVAAHMKYVSRNGKVPLETDDGEHLQGTAIAERIIDKWNLDLQHPGNRLKLTHSVVFSMPAHTPPDKLLAATRDFLREQFALKHQYVFALHTDHAHPHVHADINPISRTGERLNIRKDTLRAWREQFARHLREHGVPANATPRVVRGQLQPSRPAGIYWASRRNASTSLRAQVAAITASLRSGHAIVTGELRRRLTLVRDRVAGDWSATARTLESQGEDQLARAAAAFGQQLPAARTEEEDLARAIVREMHAPTRPLERPTGPPRH